MAAKSVNEPRSQTSFKSRRTSALLPVRILDNKTFAINSTGKSIRSSLSSGSKKNSMKNSALHSAVELVTNNLSKLIDLNALDVSKWQSRLKEKLRKRHLMDNLQKATIESEIRSLSSKTHQMSKKLLARDTPIIVKGKTVMKNIEP